MLKKIIFPLTIVVALVILALSILSSALFANENEVVAQYELANFSSPAFIETDPGVLDLVNSTCQIKIEAPQTVEVSAAIGQNSDIVSWIGRNKYVRITGLKSWTELSAIVENEKNDQETADSSKDSSGGLAVFQTGEKVDLESDMWEYSVQKQFGGTEINWTKKSGGNWGLLIAIQKQSDETQNVDQSEGQTESSSKAESNSTLPSVKINLIWEKKTSKTFMIMGISISILMIIGVVFLQIVLVMRNRRGRHSGESKRLVDYIGQKTGEFALPMSSQIPVISRTNFQSLIPDNNSQYNSPLQSINPSINQPINNGLDYYTGISSYDDYSTGLQNAYDPTQYSESVYDGYSNEYYDNSTYSNYDNNLGQDNSWQYYGEDSSGEQLYQTVDDNFGFYSQNGDEYLGGLQRQLDSENNKSFLVNDSFSQLTQSAISTSDSFNVQHNLNQSDPSSQASRKELRQRGSLWKKKGK